MARAVSSLSSSIILIEFNAFEQHSHSAFERRILCLNLRRVIEISYDRSEKRYQLSRLPRHRTTDLIAFCLILQRAIIDWDLAKRTSMINVIYLLVLITDDNNNRKKNNLRSFNFYLKYLKRHYTQLFRRSNLTAFSELSVASSSKQWYCSSLCCGRISDKPPNIVE